MNLNKLKRRMWEAREGGKKHPPGATGYITINECSPCAPWQGQPVAYDLAACVKVFRNRHRTWLCAQRKRNAGLAHDPCGWLNKHLLKMKHRKMAP